MLRRIAMPPCHRQPHVEMSFVRWLVTIAALGVCSWGCRRSVPAAGETSRSGAVQVTAPSPSVPEATVARAVDAHDTSTSTGARTAAHSSLTDDRPRPDGSAVIVHHVSTGSSGETSGFLGGDDRPLLRQVCDATVQRMERNRGGSTISFRVWFEGGARGLFKPQQRSEVANFRAELAAYRMSKLLGLHRVPPACGRVLERARLQAVADASGDVAFSERVMRELIGRGDRVPGAMLYWVPGPLENVPGTERWAELLDLSRPLAPNDIELAADLSRLIVFDFVIDNVDRWSGGNILRQHLPRHDPGPMLFMDNGASFSALHDGMGARPQEQAARLARVQRLSRSLIAALRALTLETLTAAMQEDPLGPLLGPQQIRAVLARRDRVIQHADELIRAHGEAAVFVFP